MDITIILVIIIIIYGIIEYYRHYRNLTSIPIRIHVNGTRGKSSVTRLIAGGLRAGKIPTFAKTTGTLPRMIFEDGKEIPIYRPGGHANIIEQVRIFSIAAKRKVKTIIIECMAVHPVLQWFVEHRMIHATIGVITNVRPDHLDIMGPTVEDVAKALSKTVPKNAVLFTAEKKLLPIIKNVAETLNTTVYTASEEEISEDEMHGFDYIEHRENVALALKVCQWLGVDKSTALKGMYQAQPDPGVLRTFQVRFLKKDITFVNAFSANDKESTLLIWERLNIQPTPQKPVIVIITCRKDRIQRAEQFGEMIGSSLKANYFILVGDFTKAVKKKAIRMGLIHDKIIDLEQALPAKVFDKVIELTPEYSTVVGIGNIVGWGESIIKYFQNRARQW
jgi:poly-gamma-glutamate synthase PgsB/CapB